MLSIPQMLSLDRMKPIVIPTENRLEKPYGYHRQSPKAYFFKSMGGQMVSRTHYQKMLLAAKKNVLQTGIAIKPEEWRLPKAPLPSRPDFSRCLIGKPSRNFPIDLKMFQSDDLKEYGNQGYMDPVLMLVPNIQFVSVFPQLIPEQRATPKFYTPFCNQKILHERQPHFLNSQKEETISEDENLTKANFEDYQQLSSPEEMIEEVPEGDMAPTDFGRKEAIKEHPLVDPTGTIPRVKGGCGVGFQQESAVWGVETSAPFAYQYSYVRMNSSPRIDRRSRHQKVCLQKGVRLAKSLRIWQHVPKCGRRNGKLQQSKTGQKNQLEVTGNPGTLFVRKNAKKESWPKRKMIKLKKQRPQLKIEIHKCLMRSEDTCSVSGLDEEEASIVSDENLSQMNKSPSLPDLTRLNEDEMPKKKKLSKPKDSRKKKHKKPRLQPKISEEAEAPITPEELLEIDEPRDFLTQYCIIHPNRLSIYERVFQRGVSKQTPKFTSRTRLLPQQAPLALREVSVGEGSCEGHFQKANEDVPEDMRESEGFEEGDEEEEEEEDEQEEEEEEDEDEDDGEEEEEEEGDGDVGSLEDEEEEEETDEEEEEEEGEEEGGKGGSSGEASEIVRKSDSFPKTTCKRSADKETVPYSAIQQEQKITRERMFVFKREHSDIGLTMPERYLRKLNNTTDSLMDSWNDLVSKKAELEDQKTRLLIEKAREIFPDGINHEENQEEEVSLQTVVMEACGMKTTEENTDEYILRHLTGSKMEKTKAELGSVLYSIDIEIEILQNRMQLISKDMQVLEDVTEELQSYCYEYFTFGPSDTRPVSPGFRRQQSFIYNKLHPEKDVELNFSELESTLQQVNKQLLTKKQCQYIYYILKISECCRINFRLFCVLAALSEKVIQLESFVQNLMDKLDFDALDVKIKHSKELFNLLRTDDLLPGDLTTVTNLSFELAAGGIQPEDAALVTKKLSRNTAGFIDFLDFVTYIPLFVEIHQKIIQNPLHSSKIH